MPHPRHERLWLLGGGPRRHCGCGGGSSGRPRTPPLPRGSGRCRRRPGAASGWWRARGGERGDRRRARARSTLGVTLRKPGSGSGLNLAIRRRPPVRGPDAHRTAPCVGRPRASDGQGRPLVTARRIGDAKCPKTHARKQACERASERWLVGRGAQGPHDDPSYMSFFVAVAQVAEVEQGWPRPGGSASAQASVLSGRVHSPTLGSLFSCSGFARTSNRRASSPHSKAACRAGEEHAAARVTSMRRGVEPQLAAERAALVLVDRRARRVPSTC
eukprot:scaffold269_cov404-Prasinococcus_capsulatus_cf.AAC.8